MQGNDGTGDSIRESFNKVNSNFTELYAVFGLGGALTLSSLDDGTTYAANQLIAANAAGNKLSARSLTSSDSTVTIVHTPGTIDITTKALSVSSDTAPTLSGSINAGANYTIGRLPNPSNTLVQAFNLLYRATPTTFGQLPVTVDYGVNHFVAGTASNITPGSEASANPSYPAVAGTYNVSAALKSRAQPLAPQTTLLDGVTPEPDYNQKLTGNYLATEVVQRQDLVLRQGDSMTGLLELSDHPAPLNGAGIVNGTDDLQAATKYYVDNNTYYSSVNLYVSTNGDDTQSKTPTGRQGRAWQYAYKTVSAAALQADTLVNLSQIEPGPYRQTISYTVGAVQTNSTVTGITLNGGNSGLSAYNNAVSLLENNKTFIQTETIAYINQKYVNAFSNTGFHDIILGFTDAIAYDLILGTNFNSITQATSLFNPSTTNRTIVATQLAQITDAIKQIQTQINTYSYNSTLLRNYFHQVIQALCFDMVLGSNYQSIQAALNFSNYGIGITTTEVNYVLSQLQTTIINSISSDTTGTDRIKSNIATIQYIISGGAVPTLSLPATSATTTAQQNAMTLLFNNIAFIQAEITAYITVNFPTLQYSVAKSKQNIKYIIWSLVYDMMYGGNSQSIYTGMQYWGYGYADTLQLSNAEKAAYTSAIIYLKTLVQNIITNTLLGTNSTILYQQTVVQYTNAILTGITTGDALSLGLIANLTQIQTLISAPSEPAYPTDIKPTLPAPGSQVPDLATDRQTILGLAFEANAAGWVNGGVNNQIINDPNVNSQVNILFNTIVQILTYGIANTTYPRPTPTLATPAVPPSVLGYTDAATGIMANLAYLAEDAYLYTTNNYPSFTPVAGWAQFKNSVRYLAEAVAYDLTYSTSSVSSNAASYYAANQILANFPSDTSGNAERAIWLDLITTELSKAFGWVASNTTTGWTVWAGRTITQTVTGLTNGGLAAGRIGTLFSGTIEKIVGALIPQPTLVPPTLAPYSSAEYYNAAEIILGNDTKITNNVLSYITAKYTGGYSYNQALFYQYLGTIIDALSIDLLVSGNYQSINSAKSFYKNALASRVFGSVPSLDALEFAFGDGGYNGTSDNMGLVYQILNQVQALRYQTQVTQSSYNGALTNATTAITTLKTNVATFIGIINNGYGSAPTPNYGTGLYTITFNNGGRGYVDQGTPGDVHILPGQILIGNTSGATGTIISYVPGSLSSNDTIIVQMTQPGFFQSGETLDFGATVSNLNITIWVESGIYYEDFPIKLPANTTIAGDDFRRTIIRPLNRISQSPWRTTFFYRDVVYDNLQTGQINFPSLNRGGIDYATSTSITLSATTGKITATLTSGLASTSWIGLILMDATSETGNAGKAIVTSVSGNVIYLTVIYPFPSNEVQPYSIASGSWHLYGALPYGRHYLTDPSNIYSTPLNNKQIDMFLCNDATRVRLITGQGHGGFMMVLDPTGQILTKSPYAQESASFSGSTNQPRFAGGQLIDGFTGRLYGNITAINSVNGITGTSITVTGTANSGLDVRAPQVPCSFYVQGQRYQVDYVTSYNQTVAQTTATYVSGGASGSSTLVISSTTGVAIGQLVTGNGVPAYTYVSPTWDGTTTLTLTTILNAQASGTYTFSLPQVVLTLDSSTGFDPKKAFGGSFTKLQTQLGRIVDAVNYDMVLGTNYLSVKMGLNYNLNLNYITKGLAASLLNQGIGQVGTLINGLAVDNAGKTAINTNISIIQNMLNNGIAVQPKIVWPTTPSTYTTTNQINAELSLQANKSFIQQEIVAWINATQPIGSNNDYSAAKFQRDIGLIIDAITYDILFNNGNANIASYDLSTAFWYNGSSVYNTAKSIAVAALGRLGTILPQIILNTTVSATAGNNYVQDKSNTAASNTESTRIGTLITLITDYVSNGSFTLGETRIAPNVTAMSSNLVTDFNTIVSNRTAIVGNDTDNSGAGSGVIGYLLTGGRLQINIEMGGNRSMLANDYTQINDLGYGILASNNGLTEQVSTFTYYNHTAYWALNGGQIRSVAGSNSNGDYGLRATGYDLTELPNPVNLLNDQIQTARIYKEATTVGNMIPTASVPALSVWIIGYKYRPYNNSELEVDHTLQGGGITRYEISSIQHAGIRINGQDVLELNFSTAGTGGTATSGLQYPLYDGQIVTIRALQNQIITNVATVHPTRPSTSFQYSNNLASIYRILNYNLTEATGESLATTTIAGTGTIYNNSASTSSAVMTITLATGIISTGQLVTGTGFNGTFTVYSVQQIGSSSQYVVTLNAPPSITPTGTITFSNYNTSTAMIQTDASFNYYQLSADPNAVDCADPTAYTSGYASGTVVSGSTSSYTLTVNSVSGGSAVFTGTISTTTLNVSAITSGTLYVGMFITGTSITAGTYIAAVGSGTGGTGTYILNQSATGTPTGAGPFIYGMTAGGLGFSAGGALVSNASLSGSTWTITLSAYPAITPVGTVYFATATQGKQIGDNKIAVISITQASAIAQLNSSSYITSWNGRVHRILSYTPQVIPATATYVSGGTSGTYPNIAMTVNSVAGTITTGMYVQGAGFTSGQYVTSVAGPVSGIYTIGLSAIANSTPSAITFGTASNAYITLDPNPVYNLAANGVVAPALTFAGAQLSVNNTTYEYVTYNVPNIQTYTNSTPALPPVDSWLTISGQTTSGYNGTYQVVGSTSQTTLTVASTTNLAVGMIVTSGGTFIPSVVSGNGTTVTLTFVNGVNATQIPFPTNSTIVVSGFTGTAASGYNGTYTVTSGTNTSVSYTNSTTAAVTSSSTYVSGGVASTTMIVTVNSGTPVAGWYVQGAGFTSNQTIISATNTSGSTWSIVLSAVANSQPSGTITFSGVGTVTNNCIVPTNCIVQSVSSDGQTFVVSPAAWLTPNANITAQNPTTVQSITVTNPGSGEYSTAPTIIIGSVSNGGAVVQATATALVANGYINGSTLTLVNGGYGYVSAPDVKASYGTATFTAVLTTSTVFTSTITSEIESAQVTVAYPTSVAQLGGNGTSVTAVTNTGNYITLNSVTNLTVGNQIIFTTASKGVALGNLVSGAPYFILSVNSGTSQITVSTSQGGTVFVPGTVAGISPYMTWAATSFTFGSPLTVSGTPTKTAPTSGTQGTYSVAFTLGSGTGVAGAYYQVYGNTNPMYNGTFYCTAGGSGSITLTYPSDPGTWSTSTTTYLGRETTTSTANTLGISKPFSMSGTTALKAGYAGGASGQIIVNISTCRATGHDFNQIGTGGYNTSNYPNTIFGPPAISINPANQILEETVGRVFYVTTDENGIFRVGPYFTVDQGTGTVTFSASIALSNLSGLGFKQGVVITQFSTDGTMQDNATNIVPVQSAIRTYVDDRLGLTHSGAPTPTSSLIGYGYMSLGGALAMKSNMNLGGYRINNLGTPTLGTDAVTKQYVDQLAFLSSQRDVTITSPAAGNLLVYDTTSGTATNTAVSTNLITLSTVTNLSVGDTISFVGTGFGGLTAGTYYITNIIGSAITVSSSLDASDLVLSTASGSISFTSNRWRNISIPTGDVNITYSSSGSGALTTTIQAGKIYDSMINASAAIAQSKLAMTAASTLSVAPGSYTQSSLGLSVFNSSVFSSTYGWIDLVNSTSTSTGVLLNKLQYVSAGTILGNWSGTGSTLTAGNASDVLGNGAATTPSALPFATITKYGNAVQNSSFNASGIMAVSTVANTTFNGLTNTGGGNTYQVLPYNTVHGNGVIPISDANGIIDVTALRIAGLPSSGAAINATGSTSFNFFTPAGVQFMSASGTSGSNLDVVMPGILDTTSGVIYTNKIAAGNTNNISSSATIQGQWSLVSGSTFIATYSADLAEYYEGDAEYEVGTVVVFGGDKEITITDQMNDTRLAGVVGEQGKAAYIMYSDCPGLKNLVALAGRVPCKVVGRVKKGDMLTTAATPGYAVKATTPTLGAIIGKALEDKDYGEAGIIEVAVGRN